MSILSLIASTLDDCEKTEARSGLSITYEHPSGAWVRVNVDTEASDLNPLNDSTGVYVAYLGADASHYSGNVQGIFDPDDLTIICPRCEGDGEDPQRWAILEHGNVVASGTGSAMDHVYYNSKDDDMILTPAACTACNGEGDRSASLARFLREEHGAIASVESSTRGYNSDAHFVLFITEEFFGGEEVGDARPAAEAFADEYAAWARGDVYSITTGDSLDTQGETVWGFIGEDFAREQAACHLAAALAAVQRRADKNIIRAEN